MASSHSCAWQQRCRAALQAGVGVGVRGDRGRYSKAFWDGGSGLVVVWAEVGTGERLSRQEMRVIRKVGSPNTSSGFSGAPKQSCHVA